MTKQLFVILSVLTTLLFLSSDVFAHAKLVSSDPAPRSVVSHSPESITILFNQQLEPAYSTIVVKNSHGKSVTDNAAVVDPKNNKRLTLALPNLASDKYTVSYKVLSLDGHVLESSYKFRVKKDVPLPD